MLAFWFEDALWSDSSAKKENSASNIVLGW